MALACGRRSSPPHICIARDAGPVVSQTQVPGAPPCTPAARPAQTKQRLPTRPFAPAPGRSTLPPPPAQEAPAGRSIGVFQSIGGPICSNGCSPCLVLRWPQAKADRSTPHGHPPRVQRPEPPLQPCWNAPRSTRTNNGSSISRPGGGGGHEGGGGRGGSGDRLTDETTGQIVQWQTVCLRSTHLLCAAFRRMLRWHPAGKAKCGSRLISHPDTHITTRPLPECGLQHNAPEAAAWEEVAARQDGQPPEGWRATTPTKAPSARRRRRRRRRTC